MATAKDRARGDRIAALRKKAGYTQAALAATVGTNERTIRNWERGEAITWPNLVRLANVLKVRPEFIVGGPVDEADTGEPSPVGDLAVRVTLVEDQLAERRQSDQLRGGFPQVAELIALAREENAAGSTAVREDVAKLAGAVRELGLQVGALRRELAAQQVRRTDEQQRRTRRRDDSPRTQRDDTPGT